MVAVPDGAFVSTLFFASSSNGPFGCTGQPRCTQRLNSAVKLGTGFFVSGSSAKPLFRTNAVRRVTSPTSGFSRKVAITNSPSGKFEIGPRSTSKFSTLSPVNAGRTANPSAGSVRAAPIVAPSPTVATVRKALRSYDSWCSAAGSAEAACGCGCLERTTSRTQSTRKRSVTSAPASSASGLITRPMSVSATPTANPIGQRLGP